MVKGLGFRDVSRSILGWVLVVGDLQIAGGSRGGSAKPEVLTSRHVGTGARNPCTGNRPPETPYPPMGPVGVRWSLGALGREVHINPTT